MSKLTKFLESFCEPVINNAQTISIYYKYAGMKIRVSDHLPVIGVGNEIHILLPKNRSTMYILCLNGQLHIHDNFTTLRKFLEHWKLIMDCQISKAAAINNSSENKQIIKLQQEIQDLKTEKMELSNIIHTISKDITSYNFDLLTTGQRKQIVSFISISIKDPLNKEKLLSKLIK